MPEDESFESPSLYPEESLQRTEIQNGPYRIGVTQNRLERRGVHSPGWSGATELFSGLHFFTKRGTAYIHRSSKQRGVNEGSPGNYALTPSQDAFYSAGLIFTPPSSEQIIKLGVNSTSVFDGLTFSGAAADASRGDYTIMPHAHGAANLGRDSYEFSNAINHSLSQVWGEPALHRYIDELGDFNKIDFEVPENQRAFLSKIHRLHVALLLRESIVANNSSYLWEGAHPAVGNSIAAKLMRVQLTTSVPKKGEVRLYQAVDVIRSQADTSVALSFEDVELCRGEIPHGSIVGTNKVVFYFDDDSNSSYDTALHTENIDNPLAYGRKLLMPDQTFGTVLIPGSRYADLSPHKRAEALRDAFSEFTEDEDAAPPITGFQTGSFLVRCRDLVRSFGKPMDKPSRCSTFICTDGMWNRARSKGTARQSEFESLAGSILGGSSNIEDTSRDIIKEKLPENEVTDDATAILTTQEYMSS